MFHKVDKNDNAKDFIILSYFGTERRDARVCSLNHCVKLNNFVPNETGRGSVLIVFTDNNDYVR